MSRIKLVIAVTFLFCVVVLTYCFQLTEFKVKLISITSATQWVKYKRLTNLLALGVSQDEAIKILGQPHVVEQITGGVCWKYLDDTSTSGWFYFVEFTNNSELFNKNIPLKISYIESMEHNLFKDSEKFSIGKSVDKLK